MCETRWVENHDGLLRFKEIFEAIASALEDLSSDSDCDISSKASSFLRSISTSTFAVSLCCLNCIFGYTLPLCKMLQSTTCDLLAALQHVELILSAFKTMRINSESEFVGICRDAEKLLEFFGQKLELPRIVGRQQHRENINKKDPGKYYRITIMIPLLEDFYQQLVLCFANHKSTLTEMHKLIPFECARPQTNFEESSLMFYSKFLEYQGVKSELRLWQTKWC